MLGVPADLHVLRHLLERVAQGGEVHGRIVHCHRVICGSSVLENCVLRLNEVLLLVRVRLWAGLREQERMNIVMKSQCNDVTFITVGAMQLLGNGLPLMAMLTGFRTVTQSNATLGSSSCTRCSWGDATRRRSPMRGPLPSAKLYRATPTGSSLQSTATRHLERHHTNTPSNGSGR